MDTKKFEYFCSRVAAGIGILILGFLSLYSLFYTEEFTANRTEELVRQAAAKGAEIVLLPELFERPYFCQERRYEYYEYAQTAEENPAVRHFSRVAAELGIVIPVSFYEKEVNNTYNSVAVLDADGNVDKEASRRVEVKFRLKDDEMIEELSKIMAGSEESAADTATEAGADAAAN